MKSQASASGYLVLACSIFLLLLVAGCARPVGPCITEPYADLSGAGAFAVDDRLPFQFPLDDVSSDASSSFTLFCAASSGPESARKYHAAEDYFRPAGTAVYAIADGVISFSGPMGGYGLSCYLPAFTCLAAWARLFMRPKKTDPIPSFYLVPYCSRPGGSFTQMDGRLATCSWLWAFSFQHLASPGSFVVQKGAVVSLMTDNHVIRPFEARDADQVGLTISPSPARWVRSDRPACSPLCEARKSAASWSTRPWRI